MTKTLKTAVLLAFTLSAQIYAKDIGTKLEQSCVQEQLKEHKGLTKNSLNRQDFKEYCACESEFIQKNTSDDQLSLLIKPTKAKPEWLGDLKMKAFKSCLENDTKMST
jgi:hypothetical protein